MLCVVNCGTTFIENIKNILHELNCQFKVVELKELDSQDFSQFSGIIISGSPTLLTQVDLLEYLCPFKFVKETKLPILGICLGHQIIGLLYGSEIQHGSKIHKKEKIEFLVKDKLFAGSESTRFQEEHSEYISLPKEFLLLAKSPSCGNEAMKHKEKMIYGLQFHPEVSGAQGIIVFKNFVNICLGIID